MDAVAAPPVARRRWELSGTLQGVGFRPFVHRLAERFALGGWVRNTREGAALEVEGAPAVLALFERSLMEELPAGARIHRSAVGPVPVQKDPAFVIRPSRDVDGRTDLLAGPPPTLPDRVLCDDCLRDLFNPADRRFRYPFIACAVCGPRFSVLEELPYDRARTSLRLFPLCDACRREYEDPRDRRFHAQTIACPDCGPQAALWAPDGSVRVEGTAALAEAAEALRRGRVLALKGVGGFQLLVDARNEAAVAELRRRKNREAKPFAVMAPGIVWARRLSDLSPEEERLLRSPEGPIVLAAWAPGGRAALAPSVAPGVPTVGLLWPTTPLHALLLEDLGFPLVATSGNLADEPLCTDEREALARLGSVADLLLVHNRPITRPLDDSVARVLLGETILLRRARGYAPAHLPLGEDGPTVLAAGSHLKNAPALALGDVVIPAPHVGDLDTEAARDSLNRSAGDLRAWAGGDVDLVAVDAHPDYASTRAGRTWGAPTVEVQHHHAHIAACLAEHGRTGPVLGVAWDGSGDGGDGTLWGGEFLASSRRESLRRAHLRSFALPGGERAVREPRRSAWGLCREIDGDAFPVELEPLFTDAEQRTLGTLMDRNVQCPRTTSAGRLFDAVAALLGLADRSRYEGEAALALENAAVGVPCGASAPYPFLLHDAEDPWVIDWEPLVRALRVDRTAGEDVGRISARFHATLAAMIRAVARRAGEPVVALSGGCFQNARLLTETVTALREDGRDVLFHRILPTNDGGLAVGQAVAARARRTGAESL
jgi:hydrogenase maturation protein HypF